MIVALIKTDEVYAGKLLAADVSVHQDERDIVLGEPALRTGDNYKALNYSTLFIPGRLVSSVAVVPSSEDLAQRQLPIGGMLFPEQDGSRQHPNDSSANASSTAASGTTPTTPT